MRHWLLASTISAFAIASLVGCSDDDKGEAPDASPDVRTVVDASREASSGDDASGSGDAGANDASQAADARDAAPIAPQFVAHFDKAQGQLPEGLWGNAGGGVIVSWAPLASLQTVSPSGAIAPLTTLGTPAATFTTGITTDASGKVYVGVGAASVIGGAPPGTTPVTPAPGIYAVPKGGAATAFSLGSKATPPMSFPNGLVFVGTDLYVADSGGVVYKIDSTGAATAWSQDPLLAPSQPACAGVVPLSVGANGIVADSANIYVTNTNYGRILKIAIGNDGKAGAVTKIVEDCAIAGADGLVREGDGSFLVAVNAQNRIVRVSPSGAISVLAQGAPLDTPTSVYIDTSGPAPTLWITNASFFSAADAGAPGVLTMPL